MIKPIIALKWRICGCYNPLNQISKNDSNRAQNRAKYEVWKYLTFGPGRGVYGGNYAYQIVDSHELSQGPLYINDPWHIAAMALIIAEMEGHKEIAIREPRIMPKDKQTALTKISKEEDQAIDRVVSYFHFNHNEFRDLIDKLKQQ